MILDELLAVKYEKFSTKKNDQFHLINFQITYRAT